MKNTALALTKKVDSTILFLRAQKVILDADLAELYGVSVKRLNEQVKRNISRFPSDFLFRLSRDEYENLRSQFATSSSNYGGRRYLPHAFTEHGAIMAATVLNSKRAIEMSIFVVRAFVRMREASAANQQIESKLAELERRLESHDGDIQQLIAAIRELKEPEPANPRRIGFETPGLAKGQSKGRNNKVLKIRAALPRNRQ
jgi:phage regulator Rha-like protein